MFYERAQRVSKNSVLGTTRVPDVVFMSFRSGIFSSKTLMSI